MATRLSNSEVDFQDYIDKHIQTALTKGAHRFSPTRDFTKVLSALIAEGMKHDLHIKAVENTIYIARKH